MNTSTKISLLAVGLALASLPFVSAADNNNSDQTNSAPAPVAGSRHPRLRAMLLRRQVVAHQVARRLGLSQDQTAQLKSLRAQTKSTIKGIRADSSLTAEQKKAKVRETLQGTRAQMNSTLTPDQQAQLKQMREQRKANKV